MKSLFQHRNLKHLLLAAVLTSLSITLCQASEQDSSGSSEPVATDVEWFRDAKFGMFVHWGMSSELGGIWDGKRYYGITEWLMRRGEIMSADYKERGSPVQPGRF
jgi:alpha-L-fucosidase